MMNDEDDLSPDDDDNELPTGQRTVDASSRRGLSKQRREQIERRNEAAMFWKQAFAHEIGRRELWNLLQELHPFETKFGCTPTGFPNPEATWAAHGEQQAGLRIFQSWLILDRDGTLLMQSENDPRFAPPAQPRSKT